MEHTRYHLVFEGFLKDINKTEIGLSLKSTLSLNDSQVADLMAGRRTVLKNNLPKEDAMKLGRELTQSGLKIKAQALAVNQKNNPEDLRKHLLDGGLDQYFASKYKHPDDELDTRASMLILAAFPVVSYLILPLIGLSLLFPVISLSIWSTQPVAALIQLIASAICFAPIAWLWPKPAKIEGIEIDHDTEELLERLVHGLAEHLNAPKIKRIELVESPVLAVHQSPVEWLTNSSTLEVGLPVLEALNLQQFVGLLAMRITPLSLTFYSRSWGLFIQWYNALRSRYKPWAVLLDNWVLPMHEHQDQRGAAIARDLVGFQESLRIQRIEKRFSQLNRDWPEFVEYCRKMRIKGTHWEALVEKEAKSDTKDEEVQALFRMATPALWVLSTTDGYQRAFSRRENSPAFEMPGLKLWQHYQKFNPLQERFSKLMIRPEALVPPSESPKKQNALNAIRLNKQATDVLQAQRLMIETALVMHEKPKKPKDVNKLIAKWRTTSAGFWPEGFMQHKLFPLAKKVFLTLQTLQQIDLWNIDDRTLDVNKHPARDKQILTLHKKWLEQASTLPALPLLGTQSSKLIEQIQISAGNTPLDNFTKAEIIENTSYWLDFVGIYWTFIAGQILQPKTFADEMKDQ